jgi:tetratricopeptide (TPR) repeat protein
LKSCYSFEAEVLAGFKDLAWAIKQLENIKVFDPRNIWLLMTLIDIYTNKKDYKKVESNCREAIAVDDSVAKVHVALGISLAEQKQYAESLIEFDKAISIQPNLWGSYIGKTSSLIFLGKFDECIRTCTYAIERIPNYLRERFCDYLYYNMAAAYARKGSVKEALENLKKAVKIGGKETLASLRKDKDGDFCLLYENTAFKRIREAKLKRPEKKKAKKEK